MDASAADFGSAIACYGLCKDFGDGAEKRRVLHGVDVAIAPGQMTMLEGPSGCGKTTLISLIGGILAPTEGEVMLWGQRLRALSARDLGRFRLQHIGFVFQQFHLLPALTAAENVTLPLMARGWRKRPALDAAHALLAQLGMEAHANKQPLQLSGGQQQRVAIARALIHRPRLIICDEPTAALDARSGQKIMELLHTFVVDPDRACLVVTHDQRIHRFADRIIAMDDGRISNPSLPAS
ncbi:MAG: ABC transporter ATP-binding protein [Candidatus Competibacteraceae bacterium]|nr:ABC transporter ATP-binding protein [Candidatus Competibacteraceae bacterium]MBK8751188.1 ABC transporter ATP-binding protein [Candidatus Competibacteraceae bacterium]